jgi:hypothetical protein
LSIRGETGLYASVCLKLSASELSIARGNSFARDLLMMSWRDFCGLSDREIGHRLGHADAATVGKRFAQLCRDSDLHHGIQKAAVKVKKRTIDNCKTCPLSPLTPQPFLVKSLCDRNSSLR